MLHDSDAVAAVKGMAGTAIAASVVMRKLTPLLFAAALIGMTACEQRTETQTVTDTTGTTQTKTTTVSATMPSVDTAATAQAKQDATDAARDAAHATGTAMETAGKQIQENTKTDTRHD